MPMNVQSSSSFYCDERRETSINSAPRQVSNYDEKRSSLMSNDGYSPIPNLVGSNGGDEKKETFDHKELENISGITAKYQRWTPNEVSYLGPYCTYLNAYLII